MQRLVALAVFTLVPSLALALPETKQPIMPLSEIKTGMKGYGLTVFQGTKPERFDVTVIGVLHHFLPRQDIVLIRSEDPRLKHSGIVAGMSGSPVYIDDRLVGAVAYGWHFSKDPIAGVTPIGNMLADAYRPLRGPQSTPLAQNNDKRERADAKPDVVASNENAGSDPRLVRASVPLSLSGFSPGVMDYLSSELKPYGVVPMQAGGAGRRNTGPTKFEPGSAISVELVRGDVSAAGTGTVTYVEGNKIIAFGHPMFNVGEVYLPIATAEVHTFLPAVSSSFKIASPLREIGTLQQDRQSGISGDVGSRSEMVPMSIKVHAGKQDTNFKVELARHRFLTPMLAASVVANAAQNAASDVAEASIVIRTRLDVRGQGTLELKDSFFAHDGLSPRTLGSASGLRAISEILFNPFTPAFLDNIDVDVSVEYKTDVADLIGVSMSSDEVDPGARPSLYVTLRKYAGGEKMQTIPLDIPAQFAGQPVKLSVASGNLVKPEMAAPENLKGVIENLRKGYSARALVVTLEIPDEGVLMRGQVVPDLPSSVLDTLRPATSSRRGTTFKRATRVVVPMDGIVQGKQELSFYVRPNTVH